MLFIIYFDNIISFIDNFILFMDKTTPFYEQCYLIHKSRCFGTVILNNCIVNLLFFVYWNFLFVPNYFRFYLAKLFQDGI